MGPLANVRSVSVLEDLNSALLHFGDQAAAGLHATEQEIRITEEWLQQRIQYWRNEVQRCEAMLRQAEASLARCRASGYRDPRTGAYQQPACIAEQQGVERARLLLQKSRAELDNVSHWAQQVAQASAAYRARAESLSRLLSSELPKAGSLLRQSIARLNTYLAASLPGGVIAATAPSPASPAVHPPAPATGSWVDSGIHSVSIDQIDISDSTVHDTSDFHKVSAQEMKEGFSKLQAIVTPAVAHGADGDYFYRLDAARGLSYAQGYQRIYDAFYGSDCIRLNRVGDRYQVVNGYHRLFLAHQLGIDVVPARVIVPTP